ncbi:MAG: hypothetical protein M3Y48_21255 [Actinomycetota bacterium]|nr:hypothetical protein [Actinomycetota bacterium]
MAVVIFNGLLHDFHGDIGLVTGLIFAATAEEVIIDAAVSALAALHDEALAAAGAPDDAFEIVVMGALSGAAATVGVEYPLGLVEEFFGDQWLVAAGILNPFVSHVTHVVAVAFRLVCRTARLVDAS